MASRLMADCSSRVLIQASAGMQNSELEINYTRTARGKRQLQYLSASQSSQDMKLFLLAVTRLLMPGHVTLSYYNPLLAVKSKNLR